MMNSIIQLKKLILMLTIILLFILSPSLKAQNNNLSLNPHILRNIGTQQFEKLTAYRALLPVFQEAIQNKCGNAVSYSASNRWHLFVLEADNWFKPDFNYQEFTQLHEYLKNTGTKRIEQLKCTSPQLKAWKKAIGEDIIGYSAALLILKKISDSKEEAYKDFFQPSR